MKQLKGGRGIADRRVDPVRATHKRWSAPRRQARLAHGSEASEVQDQSPNVLKIRRKLAQTTREIHQHRVAAQELERQIHHITGQLKAANGQVSYFTHRLDEVFRSPSWQIAKPWRLLDGLMHKWLFRRTTIGLVPCHDVTPHPDGWVAVGDDVQFLLSPRNPSVWRGSDGLLTCFIDVPAPATVQIFLDVGAGFDVSTAYQFDGVTTGQLEMPIYLPRGLRAVRLDIDGFLGHFRLSDASFLRGSRRAPAAAGHNAQLALRLKDQGKPALSLSPANQLATSTVSGMQWHSSGTDPFFLVDFARGTRQPKGWYRIELLVRGKPAMGTAKVYCDFGQGFSEDASFSFRYVAGETARRLIFLSASPRRLRFDPMETPGDFSVERLEFAPIDFRQARNEVVSRLVAGHPDFAGTTEAEALRRVKAIAKSEAMDLSSALARCDAELIERDLHGVSYGRWIELIEAPTLPDSAGVARMLEKLRRTPLISIVLPTYNTPEDLLSACLDSVLRQSYPNWELCIADDASPAPHVRRVIEDYLARDSRIKAVFRDVNGHISEASNSALSLATGQYVALLDHDDVLTEHALLFMADALDRHPRARILYSDEDKIDERGIRCEPHFKPDWNPDYFHAINYLSHLGVYERALIEKVGGFRRGVEGAQDHDLALRCLRYVGAGEIVHVPRILYHWRAVQGSTAKGAQEKDYASGAGLRAVQDHFAEIDPGIRVESGKNPSTYRIRYPLPLPSPLVSILIPTRDKADLMKVCIGSVLDKTDYKNFEVIILDNGSVEPETLTWFADIQSHDPRVRVIRYDHPFNYSAINNFGVQFARGEMLCLLNNDIEVITPEWLSEMVANAARPEIGCVGAMLYYPDDTIQHAGVIVGLGGVAGHSHKRHARASPGYYHRLSLPQNLSAVTGACLVVRKHIYQAVGGLNEESLAVAFNDVDFCLKVREAGYRNLWTPYAELYHHESVSRGLEDSPEKLARFAREVTYMRERWGTDRLPDPAYNPNLTLDREDFSIGG